MPGTTIIHGYDLMAWICHIINAFDQDTKEQLYRQFTSRGYGPEHYFLEIEKSFPFFNRTGGEIEKRYDKLLPEQINKVKGQVLAWKTSPNDHIRILAMLSYLDRYFNTDASLHQFMLSANHITDSVVSFNSLNEHNAAELNGLLLPNFVPMWDRSTRSQSSLAENPFSVIHNYIWICRSGVWNVTNLCSEEWVFPKGKNIKIICSPLTNTSTFSYELREQDPNNIFEITEYHTDRMKIAQGIIMQVLQFANQENADIVLFPEMLASPQCVEEMKELIEGQTELVSPKCIILPSSEYCDTAGKWVNEAQGLNAWGEVLLKYNKQQRFQHHVGNNTYFEPIKPDHNLYVLHMKGIGRVGIIICADIFNEELVKTLLNSYQIDLLLILTYTPGTRRFFDSISSAQRTSCEVIWCNTCAAYDKGAVGLPCVSYWAYGHEDRACYCEQSCDNISLDLCNGCACKIEIAADHKTHGEITRTFF